jgi:hypothetical protein
VAGCRRNVDRGPDVSARLLVPPLRDRTQDLPELIAALLVRTFATGPNATLLAEYRSLAWIDEAGPPQLAIGRTSGAASGVTLGLAAASLRDLRSHAWPGNVRELDHLVTTTAVFAVADALAAATAGRGCAWDASPDRKGRPTSKGTLCGQAHRFNLHALPMKLLDIFRRRSGASQKKCPACGRGYKPGSKK